MKKILATAAAVIGLSLGAYGQGTVDIDNAESLYGITIDSAANWYGGTYSLQILYLNGNSFNLSTINSLAGVENGSASAYDILIDSGFQVATTIIGVQSTTGAGFVQVGAVTIDGVSPAGGVITLALVAWNSTAGTWEIATENKDKGGVVVMQIDTEVAVGDPAPQPPNINAAWDAAGVNLIMTTIPEPTTLTLAGLGLASLLAIRRRK